MNPVRNFKKVKIDNKKNIFSVRKLKISNGVKKTYLTASSGQTKKLGANLAKKVFKIQSKKTALVIGLEGNLGGGKTTFLQGFAQGLGIKEKILSPTFIIVKKFLISNSQFLNFYHIDCYRIEKPKEILDLGFGEIIKNPQNIVTVEWANRIKKILPSKTIIIKFKLVDKNKREITLWRKKD